MTKVPRKHSPFPQQLIRLNGLAAGAITPEARNRIVFSRPSPTIFVFQRLADIAQLADL
ncbi:hypothetical protein NKH61_31225 [Mesorhizobium sp. M1005]|uniref:hypothetical protein n=1 Tax=unclassified Mesorhizobium TaxID=325217 RepID=UPI00333BBC68